MKYKIDDYYCDVIIEKKNNKNTYIRIKDDMNIYITTNYFVSKNQIKKLLDDNYEYISKSLEKIKQKNKKNELFFYLGKKYDIILIDKKIEIFNDRIYVKDIPTLNRWYKSQMKKIFQERLEYNYNLFEEKIPFPNLKMRTMKTRWGVCNKKNISITLNTELIKYDISKIDYVIIHELSHLVYFDHSKDFWKLVEKYCPNYKIIRKELKE